MYSETEQKSSRLIECTQSKNSQLTRKACALQKNALGELG